MNSTNKLDWTDLAINAWTISGAKLLPGLSLSKILEFEALLKFKFPQDFVDLYQKANGFEYCDWNEHMFSFWSLDRIVDEYKTDNDNNFVGFCDFLLNSYSIGFAKDTKRIFKYFDRLNPVCHNFKEAVLLINSSSGSIY